MAPTYELIASNTLTTTAASVTFSSIPATYTDLMLRCSTRRSVANVANQIRTRINNSTASNYSYTMVQGTGSGAQSGRLNSVTSFTEAWTTGASATADTFGSWELYIPNYTASANKPISSFATSENNATESYISAAAYLFSDSTAISELNIISASGNFVSGSSFFLYGIKNS
jgi:hypothetical protein